MARSAMPVATSFTSRVLGPLARSISNLATALRHRGEIRHLAEFDDKMLKDIGLMRSDVESALATPILYNPSWVLVRSAERHSRGERPASPVRRATPAVPVVTRTACCA